MKIIYAEIFLILVAIGAIGYYAYQAILGSTGGNTGGNGTGGILGGGYSADPNTGASNGVLNNIDSAVFGSGSGVGGETAGSSETYTGALSETISHPWQTFESIF